MFQTLMIVLQFGSLGAGFALGGSTTPEGGALLLMSFAFFGANLGWFVRKMIGGEHDDVQQ